MCAGQPHTHCPRAYHTHARTHTPGLRDTQTAASSATHVRAHTGTPHLTDDVHATHRPVPRTHARTSPVCSHSPWGCHQDACFSSVHTVTLEESPVSGSQEGLVARSCP